jgi:conjugative transfer region protein TrbK
MMTKLLERLPKMAAVLLAVLVVLVVAACAIRLRGDENRTTPAASTDQPTDLGAAKLAECRSVTYEQKDALSDCRKAWAEQRRRFLGRAKLAAPSDSGASQSGSLVPKDQSRLPPASPSIPENEKE